MTPYLIIAGLVFAFMLGSNVDDMRDENTHENIRIVFVMAIGSILWPLSIPAAIIWMMFL